MRLSGIMSAPVRTIDAGASAAQARAELERGRIQHLVVVRGRQVAGVLCGHDLRGAAPEATVEELMSSPAVTATGATDVQEAARLMRKRDIGCLPIVDGRKRLRGIVTTSDLLSLLGKGALHVQPRTTGWVLPKRGPTHRPQPRR